jgi:hypothetical protein
MAIIEIKQQQQQATKREGYLFYYYYINLLTINLDMCPSFYYFMCIFHS